MDHLDRCATWVRPIALLLCTLAMANRSGALDEVRVGYIRIAECAPIYVGIERGIFERKGLKLRLSEFPGGQAILPQVSSGVLDIGFTNLVSLINTRQALHCASLAGASFEDARHINHALLARRNVATPPASRSPLRVAVNTRDNIEELAFRRWARAQGWPPDSFTLQALPFEHMGLALLANTIDVASSVEPDVTRLTRSAGNIEVLAHQYQALGPDVAVATWATTPRWAAAHPQQAQAFRDGLEEAVAFISVHDSDSRTIIGQYTGISNDALATMGLPAFRGSLKESDCQPVVEAMRAEGWLTSDVAAQDLVLPR